MNKPLPRMTALPLHAEDLVDALDALYPPRCIGPGQSVEQAHRYAGAREIVDFLLMLKDRASTDRMKGTIHVQT